MDSSIKKTKNIIITIAFAVLFIICATAAASARTSTRNGITYTHPSLSLSSDTVIFDGVDVSNWQGTINWKKVRYSGTDFAFIRCGYTALNSFKMYEDSRFASYVSGCRTNKISLGVYYYANCKTLSEARQEARYTVQLLKKYSVNPQQPVVMDYEFGTGRLTTAWSSWVKSGGTSYARKRATQNAIEFMKVIKNAGYTPMFYSYLYITSPTSSGRRVNVSTMQSSGYKNIWIAQYARYCSYPAKVNYWQYTSSGSLSGISGRCDRNFMYYDDSGSGTVSGTKSIRSCTISIPYSQMKYTGSALYPKVTVKKGSKTLTEGDDYVLSYMNNIKKGTASIIVKGIGSYSNDKRITFKIGTSTVSSTSSSSGTTESSSDDDDNAPTNSSVTSSSPAKVTGLETFVYPDSRTVKITFSKVSGATDYQVGTKINDDDWTYVKTGNKRSYSFKLKGGKRVEITVRAIKTKSGKTYYGKWSTHARRLMKTKNTTSTVSTSGKTLSLTWTKNANSKYLVIYSANGGSSKLISTTSLYCNIAMTSGARYTANVTPCLIVDGKTFIGAAGDTVYNLAAAGKITKLKSKSNKKIYVYYSQVKGTGYYLKYSTSKSMSNAKTVNITSYKKTSYSFTGTSKKTYYVTVTPYLTYDGHTYVGGTSSVKKVTNK